MKRNLLRRDGATETDTGITAADGTAAEPQDADESRRLARRALLTGGAVVAGAVGAGAAMAATAAPARAATGDPVNVGETATASTDASSTEIVATSNGNANPTLVLTNSGSPGTNQASPPLRLTPAASSSLYEPPASTVGGDMVATYEGNLWFTHNNPGGNPIPATVHTDATSNSFMPLNAPYRILDTRSSSGRQHVLNASGNFDGSGRLLAGHTIHIDLTSLVTYGDAVTANLSVLGPEGNGWVLVWPGSGTKPEAASITFGRNEAIANLTVCGIASLDGKTDAIAISTSTTAFIVLDVAGFYVANFAQVKSAYAAFAPSASSQSAVRASQATRS